MLRCGIIIRPAKIHLAVRGSRTSCPTKDGEFPMKNLILAAFAALSLSAAVVPAAFAHSTVSDDAGATRFQQLNSYSQ
jgi:hypothetical protein